MPLGKLINVFYIPPMTKIIRFLIVTILFTMLALPTSAQEPVVGPLLQTKWRLGSPYNAMTPVGGSPGCNAIATAQIMNYHKHPIRGSGQSEPYTTSTLGIEIPSINFEETYYDWNNILDTYTNDATEEQRNAVATLVYHAGVSVKMNYTTGGAGAGSARIPKALTTYFGYDKGIQWRFRSHYANDVEWDKMLREQLDAKLPVIMVGAGHIFVVDGYDSEGRFHYNWGEGNLYNGWYFTNAVSTPVRTIDGNPEVIINIKPDQGGASVGYEMALREFTASKTSVPQNETFRVYVNMRNMGTLEGYSSGHLGVVLVDENDNIVEFLGTRTSSGGLGTGNTWSSSREINCYVPETVTPGKYRLKIVTKSSDGNWRLVALSTIMYSIPKEIPFTITPIENDVLGGGNWLSLEIFTVDKAAVYQNETFSVTVRTRAVGVEPFPGGRLGVALVNNDGEIVQVIRDISWGTLNPGSSYRGQVINNLSVPSSVATGHYQLRIVTKTTDGEWRIASLSLNNTYNSIDFGVIESGATGKITFAPADGNGTLTSSVEGVEIASGDLVEHGKKVIFKAAPNNTHYAMGWTVNGVTVLGNATDTLEITHFRNETIVAAIFGKKNFYHKIADYAKATENVVIAIDENDTLYSLVNIPTPTTEGITLTIKSVNPAAPVTLRRGKSGDLFTVSSGATLILENIIIHGADDGYSEKKEQEDDQYENEDEVDGELMDAKGALVMVSAGGTFIMNDGVVLRNNARLGHAGGVNVNGGTFTMNGGKISENTAMIGGSGGGVRIASATAIFTMNGGEISGNTAGTDGGGVNIANANAIFTMNGGEISGNTAGKDGGGIRMSGGTFTMNDGKINGNTALDGGGMDVSGSSTTFTMNGGEITGNVATKIEGNTDAGRGGGMTVWSSAKFTMNGGKITGNTAGVNAGGAYVSGNNTVFAMNGGEIIGNTAPAGNGIHRASGTVNLNGGVIAGAGANIAAVVSGTHNLNKSEDSPNNAAIIAWNKPSGTLNYTLGTSTNLTASAGATAVWQNKDGKLGISYANGENTGFIAISESGEFVTPIKVPQITKTTIKAHYANKTIMLENVPANAKVEVYNLQGKRIYNSQLSTFNSQLRIGVQTGFYIVKINNQILRVAVR